MAHRAGLFQEICKSLTGRLSSPATKDGEYIHVSMTTLLMSTEWNKYQCFRPEMKPRFAFFEKVLEFLKE